MSHQPLIVGNWKMHKTNRETKEFVQKLVELTQASNYPPLTQIGICPPFTALTTAVDAIGTAEVQVYAQNMHEAPTGAFTGEISASMLEELDIDGVVLGHSERRQYFGETDRLLARKIPAALAAGLQPIFCVGETQAERESGDTERVLRHQVMDGLSNLEPEQIGEIVIAYEPVWAIGTGLVATPQQVQEAVAFIRALVASKAANEAESVRILYGGSVKPENAQELLALEDVDGALVGGASLDAESFFAIACATAR